MQLLNSWVLSIKISARCFGDVDGGNLHLTLLFKTAQNSLIIFKSGESEQGRYWSSSWCYNCPDFVIMTLSFSHFSIGVFSITAFPWMLALWPVFVETGSLWWIMRFAITLLQYFFVVWTQSFLVFDSPCNSLLVFTHYPVKSCHAVHSQKCKYCCS